MDWSWIPPTVVALMAAALSWRARHDVKKLHVEVNSRLTDLLKASATVANSQGHDRGVAEERARQVQAEPEDDGD